MQWENSIVDQKTFLKVARQNPLNAYVSRFFDGRRVNVSLPAAFELDPEIRVVGPGNRWMVGVASNGRKLKLIPYRGRTWA